jgi:hypothetical protein
MSAAVANPAVNKPGYEPEVAPQIHQIRITLTSRNVKNLEKGKTLVPDTLICSGYFDLFW